MFRAKQHASDCKAGKCQDCCWTPGYSAGILPTLMTVSFIWPQVQSELRRPWLVILLVLPPGCQNYSWRQHSFPSLVLSDGWFQQDLSMSPSGWSRVYNPASGYGVLGCRLPPVVILWLVVSSFLQRADLQRPCSSVVFNSLFLKVHDFRKRHYLF